jgi:hypothetical protein
MTLLACGSEAASLSLSRLEHSIEEVRHNIVIVGVVYVLRTRILKIPIGRVISVPSSQTVKGWPELPNQLSDFGYPRVAFSR